MRTQPILGSGTGGSGGGGGGGGAASDVTILPGTATIGAVELKDDTTNNHAVVDSGGAVKVDASATTQPVSAASLPLPTGAATAANQATGNTSLASIDAGIPAGLGQTSMAASTPVVFASDQTALPVSAASLPLPSGAATSANQATGNTSLAAIDAGIPAGLGQTTMTASMPVVLASDQTAVPVSAASLPLPSGAATAANQATANTSLASIDAGIPAGLGQTTMAASTPVTIASDQTAIPVSAASLPLPSGAATAANQSTSNTSLASIDAGTPAGLGQTTASASMPVVLASDQTLSLPTGAATAANQSTSNTSLASIDSGIPAGLGQTTASASMPVVLASDQTLALPTGAATAANQSTANTSLSNIDAGTPAGLGQTTMSASMPVTLASDQSTLPVGGNVASGASDSGNPIKIGGRYNTSAPTLTNGQRGDTQLDVSANLKVSQGTLLAGEDITNSVLGTQPKPTVSSTYSGTAFSARLNDVDIAVKASAGMLLAVSASNINAAIRYLQIHNKTTAPANGDTPLLSYPIPAGTATQPASVALANTDFGAGGLYLSTGISIGLSTTADTFTAATTTDHVINGVRV